MNKAWIYIGKSIACLEVLFIRVINSVDGKYEDSWRTLKALLQAIPRSIHRNIL
jgi:hypothetical protein